MVTIARRIFYTVLILAGFASASPVMADELRQEIRLVTGDAFPPFADRKFDGGGIITQVVRRSFDIAGYQQVTVIWRSWLKGYEMTLEGEVDGTYPYAQTPDRGRSMLFSDPIANLSAYGWFSKKRDPYRDNMDLVGKAICLPLGHGELGKTGRLLGSGQANRVSPPDMKTCFKLLAAGRVDSVVSPVPEALAAITEGGFSEDDFGHIDESLSDMPLHFIIGPKHPRAQTIMNDFNQGLKQLRDSGELDQILGQAQY